MESVNTPEARLPRVIALHSSSASGRQWHPLADRLRGFALEAPDLHGHGPAPAWLDGLDDIVAADTALVARLAAAAPGGAYLVGHSYGGAIALRAALRHPALVRGLIVYEPVAFRVLFDRYGRRPPAAEVNEVALAIVRELNGRHLERAAWRFVDYWAGAGSFARLSEARQTAIAARMPAVAKHFAALATDRTRLDDYRALRTPVLHLSGGRTRTPVRRINELLRSVLPAATFVTLPALGHMAPISHPDAVALHIAEQLEQWERSGDGAAVALPAMHREAA